MQIKKFWIILTLILMGALSLVACSSGEPEVDEIEPATIGDGGEYNLVTLTEKAAERLGIQSEAVGEEEVDGVNVLVVPYASLIYGLNGETWAYIRNPGADSLTFTRVPITVDRIDGGRVLLTEGPDIGSHVVTVGVAELYGADTGVGK